MGILNITPDSFSDGGIYSSPEHAVDAANAMARDGADWIDIGAESTRPGSLPVPADVQISRAVPVIRAIRQTSSILLSIDTMDAAVGRAALDCGVNVINDISAGKNDPNMLPLAAQRGAPIILMHMKGTPATMQDDPVYADVTREVSDFLIERRDAAVATGLDCRRILLDPGIGFGKTDAHNLALLKHTQTLAALGQPLVIGTSRKGFIGRVTGGGSIASDRLFGTAATIAWAVANRAAVVRVHDVGPMTQVVRMIRAIECC